MFGRWCVGQGSCETRTSPIETITSPGFNGLGAVALHFPRAPSGLAKRECGFIGFFLFKNT